MDISNSIAWDRAWQRRHAVAAVLAATAGYALAGGMSLATGALGLGLLAAWAALWPLTTEHGSGDGRASVHNPGASGSGPMDIRALPLSVLDGLSDAALVLDGRGIVVAGNAAAEGLSPLRQGQTLSQWNRSPELQEAARSARATGAQQRCQVRLFSPVERSLDVWVTPIAPEAAGASGGRTSRDPALLVILRDLTEQEQLARMRVDFVANASHELRTPLTALRGFIETLQGAARDDPQAQARFLGIMQAQAERMSRLIEDLLSLSRIEMREHVAPTGAVDLAAVVRDASTALKPAADRAGFTIAETAAAGSALVTGDRDELTQVVQNLMQNAIKYGRPNGRVSVSIAREGQHVRLEVADDGIGIAPEHMPRLTERFYRVNAKHSKERGGTGLGLAIVKHIVNRHRGELRIASTPGQGSTFTVVLPAARSGQ